MEVRRVVRVTKFDLMESPYPMLHVRAQLRFAGFDLNREITFYRDPVSDTTIYWQDPPPPPMSRWDRVKRWIGKLWK